MIKEITSADNKIYKQAKKLLSRSERYKTGLYIAEGRRIVQDAVEAEVVSHIFVSSNYDGEMYNVDTYRINDRMFVALSDTETTQGIIAVCKMNAYDLADINGDTLLVSDGVSDPGNLGTLIRTAECAGVSGAVLIKGTVDPYSPKVVRSTMGSVFRLPIYFATAEDVKEYLTDYSIVVTVLDGSQNLYDIAFEGKVAVVVGNEAHGVSNELIQMADIRIRIPMCGSAESLNASVAGGIVMYEIYRQKGKGV